MSNIWHNFSRREKILIISMIAVCLVTVICFGLIRPAMMYKINAQDELVRAERIAGLVARSEIVAQDASDRTTQTIDLRAMVTNSARQADLRWVNIRSDTQAQSLTITLSNVKLVDLVAWLVELEDQNSIKVQSADISRSRDTVAIEATITLIDAR